VVGRRADRGDCRPREHAIPDLADGDPVLIQPEPLLPVRLSPFRYFFPGFVFQHWSEVDETGSVVSTVLEDPRERGDPHMEHLECAILVIHGGKLIPARCTFKTTKADGGHAAVQALKVAQTPAWADLSPAHKATLIAPAPWLRFTVTVTVQPHTSKATGRKSMIAKGKANPSTAPDWQMIGDFFGNAENVKVTEAVQQAWESRVEEIKRGV
jgi:hypothetical protein